MILGAILAADMWICDPHGICTWGHDYVGIGDKSWPETRHLHHKYPGWWGQEKHAHKPCKLGDQNWKNDCK